MVVARPAKLRVKNQQLQIEDDEGFNSVPIEDIGILVLESSRVSLSSALLSLCNSFNVAVITCDGKFLPNGLMLPIWGHSRHYQMLKQQMNSSLPFRKRVWQKVVRKKIENQAGLLATLSKPTAGRLNALVAKVRSGDPDNKEALASRLYWKSIFDKSFTRGGDDRRNILLNFGYSLIRSALARSVVAHGLCPTLGVQHSNELNSFNLVDDLIEAYRPYVDSRVQKMPFETSSSITRQERIELYKLLHSRFVIADEGQSLLAACDRTVTSYIAAMKAKDPAVLLLPEFVNE